MPAAQIGIARARKQAAVSDRTGGREGCSSGTAELGSCSTDGTREGYSRRGVRPSDFPLCVWPQAFGIAAGRRRTSQSPLGAPQGIDETPKLGHSLCAGAMAVIPVSLSLWSATASAVHPADAKAMHRWSPCTAAPSASIWRDIAEQRYIGAWGCRSFRFCTSPHRDGFLLARLDELHRPIGTGSCELWRLPRSIPANDAFSDHRLVGVDRGDVFHDDLLLPPAVANI
jgi:hypothetical protein